MSAIATDLQPTARVKIFAEIFESQAGKDYWEAHQTVTVGLETYSARLNPTAEGGGYSPAYGSW